MLALFRFCHGVGRRRANRSPAVSPQFFLDEAWEDFCVQLRDVCHSPIQQATPFKTPAPDAERLIGGFARLIRIEAVFASGLR